jgi:hypothetical protein
MSPIQAVCAASTKKKRIQKEMGMTPLCQKNSLADADDAQINIPRAMLGAQSSSTWLCCNE